MYLRYLKYLHAIVEQGSFALAANACGVSQPAISHGMKALQAHFAQPLLVREGRRHVPTDLARAVAAQALPLAQGVEALPRASVTAPDRHRLRVGLTSSAALVCGPLLYACWCLPNARRSLEMATADEGSLLEGLLQRRFDAVIAPKPRKFVHPDVVERPLYELQPQVYARKGHPLARAQSLAQLQGAAWACVGPSVSGPVDVLTEAHRVRRMPAPKMSVRCPDFASLLHLVAQSDLLAVVPHPALLGGASTLVAPLRLAESLPLYGMWLFEPRGRKSRLGPEVFAPTG
ncbi:DNA-binding transcriptional LysR family regulator [Acidovorax delafieldii]|uniref:DNA-binding transcriptional LysR family regulator n=1 Tax=Acidovorax delafieldii TaxID=47920 RepID=A0AAJ2BSM2_ACIDE|nr:LysR family transcriptional regulator [Acidovorax delafieldii]MDR6767166.1 DNA-binding transcriptional LysR family regulator [Acidovorax delafieldii]MDR6838118.1 DNA-binding transcriptional LysR family regulator [Acidovorax delafieldii]MDR7367878.1 DNA-binding transcriptional LysR family regulator [Acidovorax delafieldii]